MKYIPNDESGIVDKETYLAILKAIDPGRIIPIWNKIKVNCAIKMKGISFSGKKYQIDNLDFLRFFPNLLELEVVSKRLNNIYPLSQQTKIERLFLKDAVLNTLSPIIACKSLTSVILINVKISDNNFEPLRHLPKLKSLILQNCNVTDIAWITGHGMLESLALDENVINDYSSVKTIPTLKYVCANWRVFEPPFNDLFEKHNHCKSPKR